MAINNTAALRIGTLNVRGMAARRRQYQVNRLFQDNDLDIIAVQETKVETQQQTDRMVEPFNARYNVCVCHSVGTSGGCCLFIRKNMGIVEEAVFVCNEGRLVACDFSYCGSQWRVLCVYAPNNQKERQDFFERIDSFLCCDRSVILLGDFNCVCFPDDRNKKLPVRDQSAHLLSSIAESRELEDVGYALSSGRETVYTHFQQDSRARLDRAYVSLALLPQCRCYAVKHVSFSDHSLVMFTFGSKESKSRFNWQLWKFNVKLLDDDVFIEKAKEKIERLLASDTEKFVSSWEEFKEEIKLTAIERSSVWRHNEKRKEKELQCRLHFFLSLEKTREGNFAKEIRETKNQLEAIDIERYKGAMVRARAERLWMGETPTKRALGDEKRYASRNEIKEIEYKNEVTCDNNVIKQAFQEYYSAVFGQKEELEAGFETEFLSLMPKLEDEMKACLEDPITADEVEKAIGDLNPGKTPGPDGLGAAFYKYFKQELAEALHRLLTVAYKVKEMPPSFHRAHIVLIPKSDDPVKLQSVRSYRPISLMNVDYKIFMKVLAGRVQSVIQSLVGPHQTCGIKGRTINTNIHVTRSILECCDEWQERIAMLQLDLEKAFDRVVHSILFKILEHVNVGSVILEGIKLCYKDCVANIVVNKQLTDAINVRNSVRQGCPLSPLLFAIYLEPFCLKVIRNEEMRGFLLITSEVKILSYADDIALFCHDKESVAQAVDVARRYCKLTGSVINWSKSCGFWHGSWEETPEVFQSMQWSVTPRKYLGVPLDQYDDPANYWKEEAERVREKTASWGGRDLSMFARATACNMFLVAKVWYVLQVLCMSRVSVQKLHRVFAVFIWGSQWERTSRTNLFRSLKSGGVGLLHLFLKQVVSRFFFLRDQRDTFLSTMLQVRLRDVLPDFVVSSRGTGRRSVRGFLSEVVGALNILRVRFTLEYLSSVSKKKLYKDLLDVMLPVPHYRAIYLDDVCSDVLKRVKKMSVRPSVKTFFFKLHSGTLPVKPWLQEKGLFVPWTVNCLLCRKPETIDHIFLDCWDAIFHWDILQRTIKKDLPLTPRGIRFLTVENEGGVPYDMFMALSLHAMWKTRMAVQHADVDVRSVRENFIESVAYIRDVLKAQDEQPLWFTLLNDLVTLKRF